jgi:hypothetical protein
LWIIISVEPKRLFEYPFNPVSYNRPFNFPAYTNTYSTVLTAVNEKNYTETFTVHPCTVPVYCIKIPGFSYQALLGKAKLPQFNQAERRLRPRALRAFIMARPALVRIRTRKPWLLLRFVLLG